LVEEVFALFKYVLALIKDILYVLIDLLFMLSEDGRYEIMEQF